MSGERTADEVVVAEVVKVSRRIAKLTGELEELYAVRLDLYEQGRALDPPITQARLATAAGVTEDAVAVALRKAKKNRHQRTERI